jgi:hypothetical protein
MTRERSIESYLRSRVRDAGGMCVKLNPAGYVGIPDRLVLLPGGLVFFVEVKKPQGGVIAKAQTVWRGRLMALGLQHRYVFTHDDVDGLLNETQH